MHAKQLVDRIFEEYDPAGAGQRAGRLEGRLRDMSAEELLAYKKKYSKTWSDSTEKMWNSIYRAAKKAK